MGSSARSASEGGMVTCERCGAAYEVRGHEHRAKKDLVCTSCGHRIEALVLPATSDAKWTLVDPGGATATFGSWAELLAALRASGISAVHEKLERPTSDPPVPLSRSAAALLEETPQAPPVAARPKLSVVHRDEVRRAAPPPPPRAPGRDGETGKTDEWADDVELISLRDLQVVVPPPAAPPPPPRGTLRTLPPAAGSDAPPPPTISVEDVTAAAESAPELDETKDEPAPTTAPSPTVATGERHSGTSKVAAKAPSKEAESKNAEEAEDDAAKPSPKRAAVEPDTAPSRRAPVSLSPAREARGDSNSWMVPIAVVVIAAMGIVFALRSTLESPRPESAMQAPAPPAPETAKPTPAETVATVSPPAETLTPEPTAETALAPSAAPAAVEGSSPVVPKAASSSEPTAATATSATAEKKPKPVDLEALPLPELLDAAGKARRAGDYKRARELYHRALAESPGNVEAYSGLAACARATGDQAGAKENYQKALATSPGFLPALIGLADVEWELGEKDSARRHYDQYVKNAPNAPDRARDRAAGE